MPLAEIAGSRAVLNRRVEPHDELVGVEGERRRSYRVASESRAPTLHAEKVAPLRGERVARRRACVRLATDVAQRMDRAGAGVERERRSRSRRISGSRTTISTLLPRRMRPCARSGTRSARRVTERARFPAGVASDTPGRRVRRMGVRLGAVGGGIRRTGARAAGRTGVARRGSRARARDRGGSRRKEQQ